MDSTGDSGQLGNLARQGAIRRSKCFLEKSSENSSALHHPVNPTPTQISLSLSLCHSPLCSPIFICLFFFFGIHSFIYLSAFSSKWEKIAYIQFSWWKNLCHFFKFDHQFVHMLVCSRSVHSLHCTLTQLFSGFSQQFIPFFALPIPLHSGCQLT